MSDDEIRAMAATLEAEVRVEDAKFHLEPFSGDHVARVLVANRLRFVLLASQLLRGALAEENVAFSTLNGLPFPF